MKIKDLCTSERPREKLLARGAGSLSDGELIAVLLRIGTRQKDALQISQQLLKECHGSLSELFSLSGEQLCSFPGIGPGKACSLLSAMELGRRFIQESNPRDRKPITTSRAVYDLMIPQMKALAHEECWILLLNDASLLIDKVMLSLGGHRATVLDERIALKKALEKSASAMILVHNHPSSSPIPSKADIEITQKFRNACEACSIDLLDHVIICDDCFFSFADEKTFRP